MAPPDVLTLEPVRKTFLPFNRPCLDEAEEQEVVAALRSGWLTTGPRTKQFEKDFAAYQGVAHAVGLNSCTAGLHLALLALGIGPGDEVVTTPYTFVATCNVIVHVGATPVIADVEPDTLNLDPAAVEAAITPRTKAIIPVHFAGHPVDMPAFRALRDRHGVTLIHDAAHATESLYEGRSIASDGDITCYSFYATKNLATGEGGMLTTGDAALADRVRVLGLHGMSRDAWKRYTESGYQHYDVAEPGFKYNMFDLQAALGLHQLQKLEGFWQRRAALAARYDAAFRDVPGLRLMGVRPNVRTAHHLYVIRLQPELGIERDAFMAAMQRQNIGVGVHFRPVHFLSYYQDRLGWRPEMVPVASAAGEQCVSLPLDPALSDADQDDVITAVFRILGR
jgi:dTDP-4-amino-4,6-dideoxygalactose transaminase